MNKVDYIKLKEKIVNYFKNQEGKLVFRNKLIKDLKIHKKDLSAFNSLVEELKKTNQIQANTKNTFRFNKKSSEHYKGRIQVTKSGAGFIKSEDFEDEFYVRFSDLANALNGDLVAFEISSRKKRREEAVVIDVLERKQTQFVGTIETNSKFAFVKVDDHKIHVDFFIPKKFIGPSKDGQKVVIELLHWAADERRPEAKVIEILGFPDEPGVDVQSVFKSYNINEHFEKEILDELSQISEKIPKSELKYRLDLRDKDIFTIDPVDAKDFDDAVSLEKLNNGNYLLGVHIADVSHYVQEATLLDKEALKRGCSVYLVDRVIPMLPERLSNDLCSLVPHQDRMTYSAIMELDKDSLILKNYQIKKTLIHSKRRYSYEEVQEILEKKATDEFTETILKMDEIAKKMREKRFQKGSIDFHSPEVRFQLDENGKPTGIVRKKQLDSMKLIEEFMLMANKCVAEHIEKLNEKGKLEFPFIYRIHEKPSHQKIDYLKAFLHGMGISIDFPDELSPKNFQEIVGPLLDGDDGDIISDVAIRSMMKAIYSTENIGHFGLGFQYYSHFTSPIRRYPDLILHRILFEYEQGTGSKFRRSLKRQLPSICEVCSDAEKNAERAERDSIKLKQVEFIFDYLGEAFNGKISGVMEYGLYVEIEEFLIEGLVPIKTIQDDYYKYDQSSLSLKGENSGKVYRLGQKVKVKVIDVNKSRQTIDFELAD
jgi:ribonuclease R